MTRRGATWMTEEGTAVIKEPVPATFMTRRGHLDDRRREHCPPGSTIFVQLTTFVAPLIFMLVLLKIIVF
ncbi:MAG: hypothetical protein O7157_03370 [Wolbachia endosymbiont of Tetragnatha montana]|nr:hypothetical protein [Wolbachia endosymbiont of Tetragnatha montana]